MSYVKVNNNYKSLDGLMKEIFSEFPSAVSKAVREDVLHYPPVNIIDKTALYSVELSAPGYEKADFSINNNPLGKGVLVKISLPVIYTNEDINS